MGEGGRSRGTGDARVHAWAALLLGLCVLVYLWPVLIGGEILSPIAALSTSTPWRGVAPDDLGQYVNPLLVDLPHVDYPWRFLARSFLHEGTFPAWNPYVLGGIPFYPNTQTGLFSLFNLPLWTLPLTYGLGVSAALKLLAGAFGVYLLARQLKLGFLPGLLGGIAFAFSAVNVVWLAHETLPGVIVMLPWAVWLVERIFERGRLGSAIGLAIAIAIGLGGGHPGMQVHLLVVTGVYVLLRAAFAYLRRGDEDPPPVGPARALALAGGGLLAGVLLMAFMLLPELLATRGTVGVEARQAGQLPGSQMTARTLATIAFPDWWGRPGGAEAPVGPVASAAAEANFNERTFYAGVVALLLAAVGLVSAGGWRRKAPFAILAVAGLAVAVRVPGLIWLATHLPGLDSVSPQRLHFAYAFGVSVLAAFGLQAILDAPGLTRGRIAVLLLAGLVGIVALVQTGAGGDDLGNVVEHFTSGADFADAEVLSLTSVVWFLAFALGVAAAVLAAHARPEWRVAVAVALVLLAVADVQRFVTGYQPMGPESRIVPPETPAIAYLRAHRDEGRIAGMTNVIPPDSGLVYGLRDARGYDPPQPTARMLRLWRFASPPQAGWQPLNIPTVDPPSVRVLGALGTRYLVTEPGLEVPRRDFPTLTTVYDGADATVFELAEAAPRTLVPTEVRVTESERATGEAIVEAGFDARTTVAVERDQPGAATLAGADGSAAVVDEQNARVTLRAQLDRRGLVVLNDSLMDGWTVQVDGRDADPLHVNSVMRGVVVPAGEHEIVWRYAVPGLRLGAVVSLLTLAGLVATALVLARRRRQAPILER